MVGIGAPVRASRVALCRRGVCAGALLSAGDAIADPERELLRDQTVELEWSHVTGDPEATVFILARKSRLAGDMGDPPKPSTLPMPP